MVLSRRKWFAQFALLATGLALSRPGRAADEPPHKASKDVVQYQDRPNSGKMCGMCKFYIPTGGQAGRGMMGGGGMMQGGGMMAPGTCEVVDGSINPMGWCTLYQPVNS